MRVLLITLALCLAPLAAMAEVNRSCESSSDQDTTCINFEDDPVTGERATGDLDGIRGTRPGTRESLLRVRTHFVPELVKSVENI